MMLEFNATRSPSFVWKRILIETEEKLKGEMGFLRDWNWRVCLRTEGAVGGDF